MIDRLEWMGLERDLEAKREDVTLLDYACGTGLVSLVSASLLKFRASGSGLLESGLGSTAVSSLLRHARPVSSLFISTSSSSSSSPTT